jgi:C1A family cysteine protease
MKKTLRLTSILSASIVMFMLYSCSKTNVSENSPVNAASTNIVLHNYGLRPMQPEQWANIPVFSKDVLSGKLTDLGLSSSTLPTSYLLASPAVRDQGQIGSCTGFCGTEANEILHYYNAGGTVSSSATGISQAITNQVATSPLLSPLFLYYVERVVILKESITADKGAYMVNIPEAFQGLSNNTGSGTALTFNGTTFAGESPESDYAYPSNGSNTSTAYTTPPSGTAVTDATSFTIGTQSGTTGSSGITSHGYYVINSTNLVGDVKTALVNNKPVMMGFNVYDNARYQYFEGLNTTSYTYNPLASNGRIVSGARLLGGHAVPIIGFIDDASKPGGGVFICENSWSTSWGYHGYFYLPYSVLKSTTVVPAGSLYVAII